MKTCSFLHADFTETMKVVENLLLLLFNFMVKNSFIEKTYNVGRGVSSTHVTENKEENYLEIYIFQVSCSVSLPLLNIPNCQSVSNSCHSYCKLFKFAYVQI